MRTSCILSVMAQHLGYHCRPPEVSWLKTLWMVVCARGPYGVSLFFVVSGFLITRLIDQGLGGLDHPRLRDFYVRRAARILPLLLLVLLAGLAVLSLVHDDSGNFEFFFKGRSASFDALFWGSLLTFSFNWLVVVRDAILHQSSFGVHWAVLWSLSIEEQFYFLYPLFLKYARPGRHLPLFLCVFPLLGLGVRWWVYVRDPDNFLLGFFNSFSGFEGIAFGVLLYLVVKAYGPRLSGHREKPVLLCILGLALFAAIYSVPLRAVDFIWEPTLMEIALCLFLAGGTALRSFESKSLAFLAFPGKLSYGMYLWHAGVLYFLLPFLQGMTVWAAFGFFILATLAVSMVSYYLFEMPLNRRVRGLFGVKPSLKPQESR